MATSLPNTIQPNFDISSSYKTRILQTEFGDGYSQRAADGINPITTEYNLEWIGTYAEIDALNDHFTERAGYQSFTISGSWCPSASYKWICQDWSVTLLSNTTKQLTAKITRVYDIA